MRSQCGHSPRLLLGSVILLLTACATPAQRFDIQSQQLGFDRAILQGAGFSHVVYSNGIEGPVLHVYLEGDGMPWLNRYWIATDPTPRKPLTLALMAQDPAPSLYLGRPCYHGYGQTPPCTPSLWTDQRYGTQVLDSLAAVLAKILAQKNPNVIVLIGYSGGGALAMLLADRFQRVGAVITIAGNLDPPRWAAWHHYSPLHGSLNPASRPPLPDTILQWHLSGGRDRNIPTALVRSAVKRQPNAQLIVLDSFDHDCCWKRVWPSILKRLRTALGELEIEPSSEGKQVLFHIP